MAIITYEVEIPDDIELSEVHALHTQVIAEAIKTFIDKDHDYYSSWRLYDVESVCRELLVRVVRILSLLRMEQNEESPKVAEGIDSEFKDAINWCVFGNLLHNGHGVDLFEILSDFERIEEDVPVPRKQKSDVNQIFEEEIFFEEDLDNNAIQVRLQEFVEEKLNSAEPFPTHFQVGVNDLMARLESFQMGESPYYYVRADVLYPDKVQAVQEKYPDRVVFLRKTTAGTKIGDIDEHKSAFEEPEYPTMSVEELQSMINSLVVPK